MDKTPAEKFEEIDVERINLVGADGQLQMVIANRERIPDPILGGKTAQRQGVASAGMIFYNAIGDECGGLVFGSKTEGDGHEAEGSLTFDQYLQDQTIGLGYGDHGGKRTAGLHVWDRATRPLSEGLDQLTAARAMPDGPEKVQALREVMDEFGGAQRIFAGRNGAGEATLVICDKKGAPRISLRVDTDDNPKMEFLDGNGKVTFSFPPDTKAGQ